MNSAGKVSVFLAGCAALWLLAAFSCVSPVDTGGGPGGAAGSGGGGSGGVTFPLAINGGGARTVVPGSAELQGMTVKVNFTSPGKTAVYREFPISGGEVTLDNGTWNAEVKAYNNEPRLRGIANTSFQVNGSGQVDIRITSVVGVKTEAQLVEALDGSGQYYDSNPANENLILLENDITLAYLIDTAPGNFVIAAEPGTSRTIRRPSGGFVIGQGPGSSGYSLTLGKEGTGTLIVDGLGVDSGTGSALFYADGGRMTIKDGVEIKDVVDNSNGGAAIWVQNGGSLDMRGGKISGCEAPGNSGGAIWVISAEFTMNGGKISDCEADYGGAVFLDYGAVFTMSGGEISGNTASATVGGAVCLDSGAEFTMSGGTISGNTAVTYGGAVFLNQSAEFTMNGGEISGNKTVNPNPPGSYGGAVFLELNAEFTMNGGKISACEADYGAAIGVEGAGAVFTMNGGEISGNMSISGGGTVYVWRGAAFTMLDGKISGNTALSFGGAVFLYSDASGNNSAFTMRGGEISGNTANVAGGGVFIDSASSYGSRFIMNGGIISGNTIGGVLTDGGGVCVQTGNTFAKRGGTINANSPNEAYSVFGSKTRTTPAGPGLDGRLYVDSTGSFTDPLDNVLTAGNWQ